MNWLKQQLTEFTAWIGFALIICALIAPRWVFIMLGILLISTDDKRVKEWCDKVAPGLSRKLDDWMKS